MARRAAIPPESVGLPGGVRRRTPGLRREEVASLAGIGVTWYTWFEQGRNIQVSAHVLERIARALRLSVSDTEYLFSLAGIPRVESAPSTVRNVEPCIQDTLDGFRVGPALFTTAYFDVLASNRLADRIFDFDDFPGPFARNHIWRFFMDPKRRAIYLDAEAVGEISVRWLRSIHGKMPDDVHFNALTRALCDGSSEFKRLWEAQLTAPPIDAMRIGLQLPRYGALYFTSVRFRSFNSPDMLVLLPPADEKAAHAMRDLLDSYENAAVPAGVLNQSTM